MREERKGEDIPGKIFVGGLASDVDEAALERFFARYGRLSEVMVIKDANTRTSRGFGFVTFENPMDSEDALKGVYGKVLNGSAIRCEPATKPKHGAYPNARSGESKGAPRGRGGGGGDRFLGRSRDEDEFRDSFRPSSRRPGYDGDGHPFGRPRSPRDAFPPDRPRRREFPLEPRDYLAERRGFPPERRDFPSERREPPHERRDFPPDRRDLPPERRSFPPERREVRPEMREREIIGYGERRGYPAPRRDVLPAGRDDPFDRRDVAVERREIPERHSRDFAPERRRSFSDDRGMMAPSRGFLPDRRERESARDYVVDRDPARDYLSPREPAGRDHTRELTPRGLPREQPMLRSFGNGHEVSARSPFEREYAVPEPRGPRDPYGDREPAPRSIPRGAYPPTRGGPRDDPLGPPPARESGRGAREMYSLDDAGFGRDPYPPRRSGGPFTDDPPAKRPRGPSHPPRGGGLSRYGR